MDIKHINENTKEVSIMTTYELYACFYGRQNGGF